MSFLTDIEAELAKAEGSLKQKFAELTGKAEAEIKADEVKLAGDVRAELEKAKAAALADVQANSPGAAALVSQYLSQVEQAVVAALESHLVA